MQKKARDRSLHIQGGDDVIIPYTRRNVWLTEPKTFKAIVLLPSGVKRNGHFFKSKHDVNNRCMSWSASQKVPEYWHFKKKNALPSLSWTKWLSPGESFLCGGRAGRVKPVKPRHPLPQCIIGIPVHGLLYVYSVYVHMYSVYQSLDWINNEKRQYK